MLLKWHSSAGRLFQGLYPFSEETLAHIYSYLAVATEEFIHMTSCTVGSAS